LVNAFTLKKNSKMKIFFSCVICLLLTFCGWAQSDHSPNKTTAAQTSQPTAADWQSDLRFLQQLVHKDYSFLFKNITAKEFDASIENLYSAIPTLQPHQVLAGFATIISSFKYGHTTISWRSSPVKYGIVPLSFYWFNDGLYVEGAAKQYASLAGAKLLKVEGTATADALKKIKPLVPAENDQYFKANGLDFLNIPEALHSQGLLQQLKTSITYTFEKDGKTFEKEIAAVPAFRLPRTYGLVQPGGEWVSARNEGTTPLYLKQLNSIQFFEYLPQSKTLYVRQSQMLDDSTETIAAFYKRVFAFIEENDVEKLVLDVRLNGGGNNYKNKPIVTGLIANKKINKPGSLFVIIGRKTFSACQNLVNELSNYTSAIFVGEPTSENINFYGDTRRVELPKTKTPVFLSFAWWQDKPQWENAPWLVPHLAVDMSFADYKANRDPVLEACLQFADKDFLLDPMSSLRELFATGKLKELEEKARRLVTDPRYRFVDFETKINEAGYDMMRKKQLKEALYVFELNAGLFPKSANVWDSFGEAYLALGNNDKASECYNKALQLDPSGATGENARIMLKKIAEKKGT
jgi:tetratricopeptide (TPR) repeat protein